MAQAEGRVVLMGHIRATQKDPADLCVAKTYRPVCNARCSAVVKGPRLWPRDTITDFNAAARTIQLENPGAGRILP